MEPVVRNGNDGFISMAKIFNPFPLENWERHLKQRISRKNMMHTDFHCWFYYIYCWEKRDIWPALEAERRWPFLKGIQHNVGTIVKSG